MFEDRFKDKVKCYKLALCLSKAGKKEENMHGIIDFAIISTTTPTDPIIPTKLLPLGKKKEHFFIVIFKYNLNTLRISHSKT